MTPRTWLAPQKCEGQISRDTSLCGAVFRTLTLRKLECIESRTVRVRANNHILVL